MSQSMHIILAHPSQQQFLSRVLVMLSCCPSFPECRVQLRAGRCQEQGLPESRTTILSSWSLTSSSFDRPHNFSQSLISLASRNPRLGNSLMWTMGMCISVAVLSDLPALPANHEMIAGGWYDGIPGD